MRGLCPTQREPSVSSWRSDLCNAVLYFGSGEPYLTATACCAVGGGVQTPSVSTQGRAAKYFTRGVLRELSQS